MADIVDIIVGVITNTGFPIAMCLLLFYYMSKQNEKHAEEISMLKETLFQIKDAINQNTTAIARLEVLIDEK